VLASVLSRRGMLERKRRFRSGVCAGGVGSSISCSVRVSEVVGGRSVGWLVGWLVGH